MLSRPSFRLVVERATRMILWCSGVLYLIGFFSAYLLGPLLVRFDL